MFKKEIIKWIMLALLTVVFTACGGVSSDTATPQDIAIDKIEDYALNGGESPSIQDYIDAGVIGVNESNLADINEVVSNLTPEEVDTKEEIQTLLDALGLSTEEPIPTPTPTPTPVPDTTPPVITVNGTNPVEMYQGNVYTDAGASAEDNKNGSVSVTSTDDIDVNTLGTYTVIYSATDSAGNSAQANRTVNVVEIPDTTPPVFTSIPTATVGINQTSAITLVAIDESTVSYSIADGDSASFTENVHSGVVTFNTAPIAAGTYTFTATATDSSGNKITQEVTINTARFTRDDVNEIVTDHQEGAMWQDIENNNKMPHYTGVEYCTSLDLNGIGWRLPSIDELLSIVDTSNYPKIVDGFVHILPDLYWSNSWPPPLFFGDESVWYVSFDNGNRGSQDDDVSALIRCVR